MKLKLMLALSVLAFSFGAYAQQDSTGTGTSLSPTSNTMDSNKNASDLSPKDVCQRLSKLDTTKAANNAEINKWLYGESGRLHSESMMHQNWVRQVISSADCKSETIAGDHAFVIAQLGDMQRLLPFVRDSGIWKIDVPVYRAFYRKEMRVPAMQNPNIQSPTLQNPNMQNPNVQTPSMPSQKDMPNQ